MQTKINNRRYFFLIEKNIFCRLRIEIQLNNEKFSQGKNCLKLDVCCFFLNLISFREAQAKDISEFGFVPLKAEYLKKYHHQYKSYFKFLEDHKFISVQTYSIAKKQSKKYKIVKPGSPAEFVAYHPKDFVLKKKLHKDSLEKLSHADRTTGHLTKWLSPEYLQIDYSNAIEHISKSKMTISQKYSRRYLIEMINSGNIYYQRQGKDNRLHSILTNLSKDIRPFLRYNNSLLVSLDIKSSQPYMLAGLLKIILLFKDVGKIKLLLDAISTSNYRKVIEDTVTIMIQETLQETHIEEINCYIKLVTEGDIYHFIGDNFSEDFRNEIETPLGITDKFFNKKLGKKVTEHFGNMRDYAKRTMMEYLYCSPGNKARRYLEIKRILPNMVSVVIDKFKSQDKTAFPVLLQNLEAHLILDLITKDIAHHRADIPLYTIHDSVVTTQEHYQYVQNEMNDQLSSFFGFNPKIQIETWSKYLESN